MKLASFRHKNIDSWGIVDGDTIVNVGAELRKEFSDLRAAIAGGALDRAASLAAGAPHFPLSEISWLPVIPNPSKILCIGLNYETHRVETGREPTGHPAVFTRFADSQIGHDTPILRPRVSTALDYEGELAVIIGKGGRYIARDQAMAHVAGYACYNDASIRDWQRHTIQFTPGKNFPGTGAFGPVMVTPDEVPDYRALKLETRVNGQTLQSASLDKLIFSIPVLIEYCSSFTPLSPGDVIATGTPGGVGFKREPQLFLKPGDRVEVEITSVGTLVNHIADEH
jgi:2-keto-4-pentenoate hydratase/2-oxohepta-3-ene-1,7-dioic acid hydratase in catechol pathway